MRNGDSNDIKINNVNDTDKYVNSNHNGNSDTIKKQDISNHNSYESNFNSKDCNDNKANNNNKRTTPSFRNYSFSFTALFTAMTITLIITMMILIVQEITLNVIPYSLWWWIDYDNVDKNINW